MKRAVILLVLALAACTPEPSAPPEKGVVAFHPTTAPIRWTDFAEGGLSLHLATGEDILIKDADREIVVSIDGHRLAYLDSATNQYVALDLRDGRSRPLTRRLTAAELDRQSPGPTPLAVSADGRLFAAAIAAEQRMIITDFETGGTRTIPKLCVVFGVTRDKIVGSRECGWDGAIISVDNRGKARTVSEYINAERVKSLSPDGKLLMGCHGLITFWDATTGARVRDFPTPGCGELVQWLDDRRVILNSIRGFLVIDVRTGALTKAPGLPAYLDHRMVVGIVPE
ncbi:hypothetical protein ACQP2T_42120 [Nonomuraea sp. CA-143628]|uniref:hypothetical protein n=1 Tax=Nonomuraea sp. CA-143628 TaxID=3239997 RepID=UPI003D8B86ED